MYYEDNDYEHARRKLNKALLSIRQAGRDIVTCWQQEGKARDEDLQAMVDALEEYDYVAAEQATNMLY